MRQCCLSPHCSIPRAKIPRADFFFFLKGSNSCCWPIAACPVFQIHQGCLALYPPGRGPRLVDGGMQFSCHPWICGSFPSQLQAGTQPLFNSSMGMRVLGENTPPIKLHKSGIINASWELAGSIQTGAAQVKGSRSALSETMHETSRALNASLRNSNLNLILTALGSHGRF